MSQTEKANYFQALKAAGINFPKHYREYSTEELKVAYDALVQGQAEDRVVAGTASDADFTKTLPSEEEPEPEPQDFDPDFQQLDFSAPPRPAPEQQKLKLPPRPPVRPRDPQEMAGQRLNSKAEDDVIRTDEQGRMWLQEEIHKPAYPKPRGRRVLTYMEQGVKEQTVRSGDFIETFEVAGDEAPRVAEVKVTLPSYQVGIYRDPRFPFKVHCYNGVEGFDLFEVQDYYNGPELVPEECKRIYVSNVLCYDIRTTVRAIETEYRHLQLQGKVD